MKVARVDDGKAERDCYCDPGEREQWLELGWQPWREKWKDSRNILEVKAIKLGDGRGQGENDEISEHTKHACYILGLLRKNYM